MEGANELTVAFSERNGKKPCLYDEGNIDTERGASLEKPDLSTDI